MKLTEVPTSAGEHVLLAATLCLARLHERVLEPLVYPPRAMSLYTYGADSLASAVALGCRPVVPSVCLGRPAV